MSALRRWCNASSVGIVQIARSKNTSAAEVAPAVPVEPAAVIHPLLWDRWPALAHVPVAACFVQRPAGEHRARLNWRSSSHLRWLAQPLRPRPAAEIGEHLALLDQRMMIPRRERFVLLEVGEGLRQLAPRLQHR
jgi:hypothetical protein